MLEKGYITYNKNKKSVIILINCFVTIKLSIGIFF